MDASDTDRVPSMNDEEDKRLVEVARERLRRIRSGEDELLTEGDFLDRADEMLRQRRVGPPEDGPPSRQGQ